MNNELLNEIKIRIAKFNEENDFNLEIILPNLKENEGMFFISGDLYKLTQKQGYELEYLFSDLGIQYSMNRGSTCMDANKFPTYWLFVIDNKGNKHE